jgi:hypothetical protein
MAIKNTFMDTSKLIEIIPWTELSPGDQRGPTYGIDFEPKNWFIIAKRFKGQVAGKHYHKGTTKSKNPELLFFLEGTMKLVLKDMKTGTDETLEITGPVLLKIPPYIYHEVHPLTDVYFMEFNEERSDFKHDTVWPTEDELAQAGR